MRRHLAMCIAICAAAYALSSASALAQSPLSGLPAAGDVAGQTFNGTLTVTQFAVDSAGTLLLTGIVAGAVIDPITGATANVEQAFQAVPAALGGSSEPGVCDILFLDIQPISLDLLGLQLDLSQVVLDLDAAPGAGRLVGNLLCAVTGLLDGFAIGPALIGIIQAILDTLNGLLQL